MAPCHHNVYVLQLEPMFGCIAVKLKVHSYGPGRLLITLSCLEQT